MCYPSFVTLQKLSDITPTALRANLRHQRARSGRVCECRQMGTWCSGSTHAQHAGGPGFNPQCVHSCFGASVVEALIRILAEIESTSDVTTFLRQRLDENWPAKLC